MSLDVILTHHNKEYKNYLAHIIGVRNHLKIVKDSSETGSDWWQELSEDQKEGIERGLRDIDAGRVTPHDQVKKKNGIK